MTRIRNDFQSIVPSNGRSTCGRRIHYPTPIHCLLSFAAKSRSSACTVLFVGLHPFFRRSAGSFSFGCRQTNNFMRTKPLFTLTEKGGRCEESDCFFLCRTRTSKAPRRFTFDETLKGAVSKQKFRHSPASGMRLLYALRM